MEDTQIIDLFWKREERAVTELSNKYSGYCYKIAWNLLENHEDSEECLSSTWYAAIKWRLFRGGRDSQKRTDAGH